MDIPNAVTSSFFEDDGCYDHKHTCKFRRIFSTYTATYKTTIPQKTNLYLELDLLMESETIKMQSKNFLNKS